MPYHDLLREVIDLAVDVFDVTETASLTVTPFSYVDC